MKKIISKTWNHLEIEGKLYSNWEKAGYFKPECSHRHCEESATKQSNRSLNSSRDDKKIATPSGLAMTEKAPFTIIMPPPNANGSLHLGHAVFVTLEDIMIRYARLQGKAALWLPGADHAGFETQVVFEKKLEKEGKSRFKIPREELYQMMLDFTQENKKLMEGQLRSLGASCDWSREKFTLDKDIIKIVYQTFKKLYDDGLAYRDSRPVNWCTRHQTSLSDLEVKYEERKDPLYYIKYGPLVLATVRPETKFGDTALAVNPKDKRYQKYVGQEIEIETILGKAKIKVIADEHVDPKFGTGVVKITPAHDPDDFAVSLRHNLPAVEVIDQYGKMNEKAGPFQGMKIAEAREKVVEAMKEKGMIEKIDENYIHTVGVCYKCGTVIEPRILPQWFIAVNKKGKSGKNLAKDAIQAVKNGEVKFVTKKFEKIYQHWMGNIRDWNVSRQIVWGIRIPAWYKDQEIYVGTEPPKGDGWKQDPDVFDTWFSSGQWPFATLKTTENGDFDQFYPTSVMETAWDILFFWVARMIMLGLYVTDKVPFEQVYIHGLVRDKDRQKMSKSKGNVIDPLGVAEMYGTDAVRLALVFGTGAGNDVIISEEKIRGMRNFTNKIWNASRYVMLQVSEGDLKEGMIGEEKLSDLNIDEKILTDADRKILKKHQEMIASVTKNLEKSQFSQAGEELYDYFWHDFCDSYIEASKLQTQNDKKIAAASGLAMTENKLSDNTKKVLIKILSESLIMLHPFIPFVTEAVWQELRAIYPELSESIMIADWPKS